MTELTANDISWALSAASMRIKAKAFEARDAGHFAEQGMLETISTMLTDITRDIYNIRVHGRISGGDAS